MTLQNIVDLLENPDRLRIIKDKEDLFVGWRATLVMDKENEIMQQYSETEVKKFRVIPEIRHKQWQQKGLMQPLQPEVLAEYSFSDLQMSLYYTIYI